MITYRELSTRDPEYEQEKDLRNRVLRLPLGLCLSGSDLAGEEQQLHLAALDSTGRVVGCVLAALCGDHARIRQIAVEEAWRGRGIGAELLRRIESKVLARGITRVELHARAAAEGFFRRQGYEVLSGVYSEVTIPHVTMGKTLR